MKTFSEKTITLLGTLLMASTALADPASVHGMLVFGQKTIYLSHLPMFHSPHDYQAIFVAAFDDAGRQAYQKANPGLSFYTLAPEAFALPELVQSLSQSPVVQSAKLYAGVFDEGGTLLSRDFDVSFRKALYFKKISRQSAASAHPRYLLLGDPDSEMFLIHLIAGQPSFDQILQVKTVGLKLAASLRQAAAVELSLVQTNSDVPLKEGSTVEVSQSDSSDAVQLGAQVYFNSADLMD